MAASGVVAGLAVGRFTDNSSSRQQLFVEHMKQNNENTIHIYPDKIYIGLKKLPASGSILIILYKKDSCHERMLCENITQITCSC